MYKEGNYLRQLGVWKVEIMGVEKKESEQWGDSVQVIFEDEKGRRINGKFKTPMTDFKKKKWAELIKAAKASKASDLKGKSVAIVVMPKNFNGKEYWDVDSFFDVALLKDPEAQLDSLLEGASGLTGETDKTDEIEW